MFDADRVAQLSTARPVEADENRVLRHVVLLSLAGGCRHYDTNGTSPKGHDRALNPVLGLASQARAGARHDAGSES